MLSLRHSPSILPQPAPQAILSQRIAQPARVRGAQAGEGKGGCCGGRRGGGGRRGMHGL